MFRESCAPTNSSHNAAAPVDAAASDQCAHRLGYCVYFTRDAEMMTVQNADSPADQPGGSVSDLETR
jgi:hypothetical protein